MITLREAAARSGLTKNALEIRIRRGQLIGEKRGGVWYVNLSDVTPVNVPSDAVFISKPPSQGNVEAGEGIPDVWDAIAEQTELFEQLSATIAEMERKLSGLNAACNDLLELDGKYNEMHVSQTEQGRLIESLRAEIVRIGRLVPGAYRESVVRDGGTYEAERMRPNRLLGLFAGRRVTG